MVLRLHPRTQPWLKRYLEQLPLETGRLSQIIATLVRPASQVLISGRLGPEPWQALNRTTHCWIRVISEERGMVSSGRRSRGEVFSIMADYLARVGFANFFASLDRIADAALFDSRVILAHHHAWPPAAERYASDMGMVQLISDPWLRDFTSAAWEAPVPVLLGGHGLLSGDLLAICELIEDQ
jgi:hypothetical protein